MNIEDYRTFCLGLKGTTEGFPFGEDTLVMKVKGKVYSLAALQPFSFNVKCDPEIAVALRESYPDVRPGYHMNKTHWNTILISGSVSDKQLCQWIKDSYDLVVSKLPKSDRLDISDDI